MNEQQMLQMFDFNQNGVLDPPERWWADMMQQQMRNRQQFIMICFNHHLLCQSFGVGIKIFILFRIGNGFITSALWLMMKHHAR